LVYLWPLVVFVNIPAR